MNKGLSALEALVLSFGMRQHPRFTQDTPIRLNVWSAFAEKPDKRVQLLLAPHFKVPTADAVAVLRRALRRPESEGRAEGAREHQLIALSNRIHLDVTFYEFFTTVLPNMHWWRHSVVGVMNTFAGELSGVRSRQNLDGLVAAFNESNQKAVWRFFAVSGLINLANEKALAAGRDDAAANAEIVRWQTIGRYADMLMRLGDGVDTRLDPDEERDFWAEYFASSYAFLAERRIAIEEHAQQDPAAVSDNREQQGDGGAVAPIWSVDLNRPFNVAVAVSRRTVKADAAEKVFENRARDIRWAVIDSGIDATHPAFQVGEGPRNGPRTAAGSRVVATYDFNRLRHLFRNDFEALLNAGTLDELRQALPGMEDRQRVLTYLYTASARPRDRLSTADMVRELGDPDFFEDVAEYVSGIKRVVTEGRMIDWPLVEPLLRIQHDDRYCAGSPAIPKNVHGTHVAGILAGDLKRHALGRPDDSEPAPDEDYQGLCPNMSLYDLRVCDDQGGGDEFLVLAALQFVAYLNRDRNLRLVHGVNISLSLKHEVANYACGQTPICREAERLVGDGVVVVAAAGNYGFQRMVTDKGAVDVYNSTSITDPGNAEAVITVGSTYRDQPHSYGVSYFSSRGPTGDGRHKPDLVAPGEKISAPMPNEGFGTLDGTSMAAPHVSGAAALLMARHSELVGDPVRIKQILCRSATDLGRMREFQGHGLVDILRALQSV